jgi:hypothetical protein
MKPMNRKQIIELIWRETDYRVHYGLDMVKAVREIESWRRTHRNKDEMVVKVLDGVLYINGDAMARITSKLPRLYPWSEKAEYYEGLCLRDEDV